jgi:uncharacterized membrane protein
MFDGTETCEKGQQASRGFNWVFLLKAVNFPGFIIRRHLTRMFQSVSRVTYTYLHVDQKWQSMPLSTSKKFFIS